MKGIDPKRVQELEDAFVAIKATCRILGHNVEGSEWRRDKVNGPSYQICQRCFARVYTQETVQHHRRLGIPL